MYGMIVDASDVAQYSTGTVRGTYSNVYTINDPSSTGIFMKGDRRTVDRKVP